MKKNKLLLRSIDSVDVQIRHVLMCWRQRGISVDSVPINMPADYISFAAYGAEGELWQGWIDARDWLLHFAPDLAFLALTAYDIKQIVALFKTTERPLSIDFDALSYQYIQVNGWADAITLPRYALPCVSTASGKVWLQTLPQESGSMIAQRLPQCAARFVLPLQFELGRSMLSYNLCARIAVGDVLLITEEIPRVVTCGTTLGHYLLKEEGIVMEHIEDLTAPSTLVQRQAEKLDTQVPLPQDLELPQDAVVQGALASVPVQIEFVLQEQMMTVAELGQFYQGQVLPLAASAEQSIVVRANGVMLAKGELVQLEDSLGVELTTLYGRAEHAK